MRDTAPKADVQLELELGTGKPVEQQQGDQGIGEHGRGGRETRRKLDIKPLRDFSHARADAADRDSGEAYPFLILLALLLLGVLCMNLVCLSATDAGYFAAHVDCRDLQPSSESSVRALGFWVGWRAARTNIGGNGVQPSYPLSELSAATGCLGGVVGLGHIMGLCLNVTALVLVATLLCRPLSSRAPSPPEDPYMDPSATPTPYPEDALPASFELQPAPPLLLLPSPLPALPAADPQQRQQQQQRCHGAHPLPPPQHGTQDQQCSTHLFQQQQQQQLQQQQQRHESQQVHQQQQQQRQQQQQQRAPSWCSTSQCGRKRRAPPQPHTPPHAPGGGLPWNPAEHCHQNFTETSSAAPRADSLHRGLSAPRRPHEARWAPMWTPLRGGGGWGGGERGVGGGGALRSEAARGRWLGALCRASLALSAWFCAAGLLGFYFAVAGGVGGAVRRVYESSFQVQCGTQSHVDVDFAYVMTGLACLAHLSVGIFAFRRRPQQQQRRGARARTAGGAPPPHPPASPSSEDSMRGRAAGGESAPGGGGGGGGMLSRQQDSTQNVV